MKVRELIQALNDGKTLDAVTMLDVHKHLSSDNLKYDDWLGLGRALKFCAVQSFCDKKSIKEEWLTTCSAIHNTARRMAQSLWEGFTDPDQADPAKAADEILAGAGAAISTQGFAACDTPYTATINVKNLYLTNHEAGGSGTVEAACEPFEVSGCSSEPGSAFEYTRADELQTTVNNLELQATNQRKSIENLREANSTLKSENLNLKSNFDYQIEAKQKLQSLVDAVYHERDLLAVALARMALRSGLKAGYGVDTEKGRAVVYVELGNGNQASWHMDDKFTLNESAIDGLISLPRLLPKYGSAWDGSWVARHKNWPAYIDPDQRPSVKEPTFEVALAIDSRGREYAAGFKVTGAEIARWADGTLDFIKGK